ncbi:hypothetical protein [Arthrobacter sp.]|uniref:hypothetical protein n=1 Tax=Arthrobacter sp. TaxID=1667 RepID=UPI003A8F63C1
MHALILVSTLRKPVLRAVAFARAGRPSKLDAIIVDIDQEATARTVAEWDRLQIPVPITVLASPYRETAAPIIDYIKGIKSIPRDLVVVYIPEYVVGRWWEQLVRNQTACASRHGCTSSPGSWWPASRGSSRRKPGRALFDNERGEAHAAQNTPQHDGGATREHAGRAGRRGLD